MAYQFMENRSDISNEKTNIKKSEIIYNNKKMRNSKIHFKIAKSIGKPEIYYIITMNIFIKSLNC
jgi:hypothetical protein